MKKILSVVSVVLAVCMLLSMNVFADDKVLSDIDPSTLVGKAVNELVDLNIIDGYEDNTFRPDNTVTRAEMAKLIVAFMGLDKIGLNATSSGFEDVDSVGHWSIPYVKIAVDQGIIVGYEDGTFRPDNTVKYSEAVKMIVCALGYGPIAINRSLDGQPWYFGYISVAAEKGILNGAAANSQESPAPRGTVAVLLYNSLDVPIAEVSTKSDGSVSVKASDSTARDTYQQTEKVTGIVTAVYQTGLDRAETGLGKKFIEVTSGGKTTQYKLTSDIDTFDILGYKINANVDVDTSDDHVLTSVSTRDSKNVVNIINAEDIESATSSEISFWESEKATKKTTITFESDVSVIYNGRYLKNYSSADFNIKAGTIKTISNDGNAQADVVFINSYEIVAVRNIGTESATNLRKIYAMYNEGDVIIPSSAKVMKIKNSSGTKVETPESLSASKFDIANIMRSKDNEVFELTITRNKISGSITSITNGDLITVRDKNYSVSYNLDEYDGDDKPTFAVSSSINAYLDMFGNIAAAEVLKATADSNSYVGYLIYADKKGGISGTANVRLYGLMNVTGDKTYSLASKVKIDGEIYNDYDRMLDALEQSSQIANAGKADNGLATTDYAQLITFTLKNGQIDTIDTVAENKVPTTEDLSLDISYPYASASDKNGLAYITGYKFQNSAKSTVMAINSSTKVLVIPKDINEVSKYRATSLGYFTTGSNRYRVDGFNLSSVGVAQFVVVYGGATGSTGTALNEYSNVYLTKAVSKASGTVDGDVVMQDKFTGWDFRAGGVISDKRSGEEDILYGKIENGEIFRFSTDSNNLIDEVEMVLDIDGDEIKLSPSASKPNALNPVATAAEAKSLRDFKFDSRTKESSVCRFIYGTVLGIDGNTIRITTTLSDDDCGIVSDEYDILTCNSSVKVFTLDMNETDINERVQAEKSLSDIVSLEDVGIENANDASQVLMFYQSGSVRTILIVKR